jgi:hypothetical protein
MNTETASSRDIDEASSAYGNADPATDNAMEDQVPRPDAQSEVDDEESIADELADADHGQG